MTKKTSLHLTKLSAMNLSIAGHKNCIMVLYSYTNFIESKINLPLLSQALSVGSKIWKKAFCTCRLYNFQHKLSCF